MGSYISVIESSKNVNHTNHTNHTHHTNHVKNTKTNNLYCFNESRNNKIPNLKIPNYKTSTNSESSLLLSGYVSSHSSSRCNNLYVSDCEQNKNL